MHNAPPPLFLWESILLMSPAQNQGSDPSLSQLVTILWITKENFLPQGKFGVVVFGFEVVIGRELESFNINNSELVVSLAAVFLRVRGISDFVAGTMRGVTAVT